MHGCGSGGLAGPAKRMRAVFNLKLLTAVTVRDGTDTVCALKLLARLITPSISESGTFRQCDGRQRRLGCQ